MKERSTEKRGKLTGGALSEDAVASSRSVLHPNRAGQTTGLQQYFVDSSVSRFLAQVLGESHSVLDLTAGAGHLLSAFERRFGVEVDADQVAAAEAEGREYTAVRGDVQRVFPMLSALGARFSVVVLNPPFGLEWEVGAVGKGDSTSLAVAMARRLLAPGGVGALVAGADRFAREVEPGLRGNLFAVLRVERLFDGVKLPCVVALWRESESGGRTPLGRASGGEVLRATLQRRSELTEGLAGRVADTNQSRFGYWCSYAHEYSETSVGGASLRAVFEAVQEEYDSRLARESGAAPKWMFGLRGGKLNVAVSAYMRVYLADRRDDVKRLESYHRQSPAYFALQPREWEWACGFMQELGVPMQPEAVAAVQHHLSQSRLAAVPMYRVAPAQRIAFLPDADTLTCRVGDDARGFVAGETYRVACRTVVSEAVETREVTAYDKESDSIVPAVVEVAVTRKAMRATVGEQHFDEGAEDVAYLHEHFDLPDPGDLEAVAPKEVARWRSTIRKVEEEARCHLPGFRYRHFQVEDTARLLAKCGGVLAHEQGLGKCTVGETLLLADNKLSRMDELWDSVASELNAEADVDGGVWVHSKRGFRVASLHEDGVVRDVRVTKMYRQRVRERLRTVVLDDGSRITTTAAHKFYGLDGWTRKVEPGDVLCVPARLPHGWRDAVPLDVVRLIAWQLAEGHEMLDGGKFVITQKDACVLEGWKRDAQTFGAREGVNFNSLPINKRQDKDVYVLAGSSVEWRRWLERNGYGWGTLSAQRYVPDFIMQGGAAVVAEFLRVFYEAEGSVSPLVEVSSASKLLMEQVRHLLRRFGVWARLKAKRKCATNGKRIMRTYYTLTFGGEDSRTFERVIGFLSERKRGALAELNARKENSNWRGVPINDVVERAVAEGGVTRKTLGWRGASFKHNLSRRGLEPVLERMRAVVDGSFLAGLWAKLPCAKRMQQIEMLERANLGAITSALHEVERRCRDEVHYAHVVSVEWEDFEGYVYDVEVPGTHNYVAEGMLAHNSLQLLTYARCLEVEGVGDGCALFVMPQDLVEQFRGEARKFFGRELVAVPRTARHPSQPALRPGEASAYEVRQRVLARRSWLRRRRAAQCRGELFDEAEVPPVWAVTWYEAVSTTGRDYEVPPHEVHRRVTARVRGADGELRTRRVGLSTADCCPACGADADAGWSGTVCKASFAGSGKLAKQRRKVAGLREGTRRRGCGYVRVATRRKAAYSLLADAFSLVCVDEGTKVKGDDSLTSRAVRAFRAKHRVLATGTPLKNFVVDLFWLLWWALGDSSPRFPYSYEGGRERFTRDFAVVEQRLDEDGCKSGRPKVLPEVSNLAQLWRLMCSSTVRRRMEDVGCEVSLVGQWTCKACGAEQTARHPAGTKWRCRKPGCGKDAVLAEDVGGADVRCSHCGGVDWLRPERLECGCGAVHDAVVPLAYEVVRAPWGKAQKRHFADWLDAENFEEHFNRKHPNSPIAGTNMVKLCAAAIGQLVKLEYATNFPVADPDPDFKRDGLSPWTPAMLRLLEGVVAATRLGHRVLLTSTIIEALPWMVARLLERGVAAEHVTEEGGDGRAKTLGPKLRSGAVSRFRAGEFSVLAVGAQAIALGHNLDCASHLFALGLPWDFATWDQQLKRVRRLTSRHPVYVHGYWPENSLGEKKWRVVCGKTAASDVVLDGRVTGRREEEVDKSAVLRELQEKGAEVDGSEVSESDVAEAWRRGAPLPTPGRRRAAVPLPPAPTPPVVRLAGRRGVPVPVRAPSPPPGVPLFGACMVVVPWAGARRDDVLAAVRGSGVFWPAPDSHLYAWAPPGHYLDAAWLAEALGFRPAGEVVWRKPELGGEYFSEAHECLLFAVRGRPSACLSGPPLSSCWDADYPRGRDGRVRLGAKPALFFELVERRSRGPHLSLFAESPRPGWASWCPAKLPWSREETG